MKMLDNPAVNVETVIAADADRIYEIVSDLDAMASFGTEFQSGEWVSGRPGEVGATFRGRQRLGDREWETLSTVMSAETGREFSWVVGNVEEPTATWKMQLHSVPGGTEVSYGFVHGPGPSGLRDVIAAHPHDEAKFIESRLATLQENMVKTLEGIRRRTSR